MSCFGNEFNLINHRCYQAQYVVQCGYICRSFHLSRTHHLGANFLSQCRACDLEHNLLQGEFVS